MSKVLPFAILAIVIIGFGAVLLLGQGGNTQQQNATISPTAEVTQPTTPSASAYATSPTASPATAATSSNIKAVIKTSKGTIELELYSNDAPKTVENFASKAKSGFYNNLAFHRVEDWVIQGGDPKGTGSGGRDMPTELNDKPFVVGSLGVARKDNIRISNDAQFFITKQAAPWLNSQYTNFGKVTKGMDVVTKIAIGDKILGITVE